MLLDPQSLFETTMPSELLQATPRSPCLQSYTPPNSPTLAPSSKVVTINDLRALVELFKATPTTDSADKASILEGGSADNAEADKPKGRTSRLEYKKVDEMLVSHPVLVPC